jgi:hypothetical protein
MSANYLDTFADPHNLPAVTRVVPVSPQNTHPKVRAVREVRGKKPLQTDAHNFGASRSCGRDVSIGYLFSAFCTGAFVLYLRFSPGPRVVVSVFFAERTRQNDVTPALKTPNLGGGHVVLRSAMVIFVFFCIFLNFSSISGRASRPFTLRVVIINDTSCFVKRFAAFRVFFQQKSQKTFSCFGLSADCADFAGD